jgi:DNA processing protein
VPLTARELEPLLRLALVQGVGPQRLTLLLERFGSADAVVGAPSAHLRSLPGIGPELTARIRTANSRPARSATRSALEAVGRLGAVALTPADPAYPHAFRSVADPPYLLFAAGDLTALERPGVAVVGTRSPTRYGREAAERLSFDLAFAGLTIISGLARGIDSAAHLGALNAGGTTIAVLGHGIDQVYPPENHRLFARLRHHGLLITEYPPGETPKAGNFPRRNRLITALAEAVVVVEMGVKSGAQHTVGFALDQGKEVMAVPGSILSPVSGGTNQLIKDGARLVSSAQDVLEELRGVGWSQPKKAGLPATEAMNGPGMELLTSMEEVLFRSISTDPLHVDEIASGARLSTAEALTTLLHMELRGLVTALPGKRYCRT